MKGVWFWEWFVFSQVNFRSCGWGWERRWRRETDPPLVASGGSTPATIGLSWRPNVWRQSPGASGGYQLRLEFGGYRGRGYRDYGRGRGVYIVFG